MSINPKRLLCIVGSMDAGGAETFLMKIYRNIDRKKYQIDFYVATQAEGFYDNEIQSMGGRIYQSIPKSHGLIKSLCNIQRIVKAENYKYVLRVSQHSLSTLDLIAAKLGGASVLAYRSSNSNTGGSKLNQFIHRVFKLLPMTIPDIKIAPSNEAARFMFGKSDVKRGKVIILNNAIDLSIFEFNKVKREKIRNEFDIVESELIIGHVGRFNLQKNHEYLIDIFYEIVKINNSSKLVLVGKGELESEIKKKIEIMGLTDKVIFAGVRSDVQNLLMAMDIFIFPSYFEGMPNTVIEAQATGLKCIISDTITREANITNKVEFLSIDDIPRNWALKALEHNNASNRNNMKEYFVRNGYDINQTSKSFVNIFFGEVDI